VCQWIHAYLDRQSKGEGAAVFKIRAHAAFYAACHIPFYVLAARHRDIVNDRKRTIIVLSYCWNSINLLIIFAVLARLQALDLNRIVNSPLNPLRYCHATTVRQFAESASHLQVVLLSIKLICNVINQNSRLDCILSHHHDS
jgi:hypothetical protein